MATREQLLALEPGQSIRDGDMSVARRVFDPRYPRGGSTTEFRFRKRYLEGDLDYFTDPGFVRDVLPEPWELISDMLDEAARKQGVRRRDGTPV